MINPWVVQGGLILPVSECVVSTADSVNGTEILVLLIISKRSLRLYLKHAAMPSINHPNPHLPMLFVGRELSPLLMNEMAKFRISGGCLLPTSSYRVNHRRRYRL